MKDLWKNLKFAWIYTKDQKGKLIAFLISNILHIIISVVIPILSATIIVHLTNNQLYQVLVITLVILGIELFRNFINYANRYLSTRIYRESFNKLQTSLGREILRLENSCIDKNSSGVFIQRLTNDTSRIADIFNVLNIYLTNILTNIGIFGAIFIINKTVFVFVLFMVFIIYLVENSRVSKVNERDKVYRKKHEKASGFIGELVRGVRDIKMLSAEDSFLKELDSKIIDLNQERYDMIKVDINYTLIRGFCLDIFDALMIFLLVYLIYNKALSIASALVIHNYMGRVTSIVNYASMFLEKIKDFNLSTSRIFAIINSPDFPKEKFGSKHLSKVNGNFEFKNVTFSYSPDEEAVLKNISFKVKANETVAFVGKSGAGKTTIFNLLCKMYDVTDGAIYIDKEDIQQLDKASIRDNITIISQNPYIFNLTIRQNLQLVKKDLTEEEMIEACHLASLDEFINTLPDKYDTLIGEGGVNLSGGEKQRLAIARALIQKTEIILFDEATSALDNETQANIQKAIENLQKDYTILIIAHRLSTVINSDRILFLNNGHIEAQGTHQELLKTNKNYRHLYEAELKNN